MAYDVTPVNYSTGATDPTQDFTQGLQAGNAVVTAQLQQQQAQLQIAQQAGYQRDIQQWVANGAPPTGAAIIAAKYPGMADSISKSAGLMDSAQKQDQLQRLMPVMASLYSGRPDMAVKQYNDDAAAYDAAGRPQDAAKARTMAQFITAHPDAAKASMSMLLVGLGAPSEAVQNLTKIAENNRTEQKLPDELSQGKSETTIKNVTAINAADMAAAKLREARGTANKTGAEGDAATDIVATNLAKNKADAELAAIKARNEQTTIDLGRTKDAAEMAREAAKVNLAQQVAAQEAAARKAELELKNPRVNIPEKVGDKIDAAVKSGVDNEHFADQMDDLASKFEKRSDWLTGGLGIGLQTVKNVFGKSTTYSELLSQAAPIYGKVMKDVIMQGGGISRITDADLRVFADGIPKATDPPSRQVAFLRGFSKAKRLEAITNQAEADWTQQVLHTGRTPRDISVSGIAVPAGTTFDQFLKANAPRLTMQAIEAAHTAASENSIYGPWMATPPAPQQATPSVAPPAPAPAFDSASPSFGGVQ